MKYFALIITLVTCLTASAQSDKQRVEKAVFAQTHEAQTIICTKIMIHDQVLNHVDIKNFENAIYTKEGIVFTSNLQGKEFFIYHFDNIDWGTIKTFLIPFATSFDKESEGVVSESALLELYQKM